MSKQLERQWAEDIFSQLKWGKDRRSGFPKCWSWGIASRIFGKDPMTFIDKDGSEVERTGKVWVRFSVTGLVHTGKVYVFLTGGDDYTVLIVGPNKRIIEEFSGIYCDELSATIHRAIEDPGS